MRGPTSQKRFDDAKTLLDYGFANFSNKVIVKKGEDVTTVQISKANKTEIKVVAESDLTTLLNKGDEKNIRTEIILNENISAPLEYLEPVGVIKCYLNEEEIGQVNLVSNEKVESKKWGNFFTEIFELVFGLGR